MRRYCRHDDWSANRSSFWRCLSLGAIDDALRYSITKMTHLHFSICQLNTRRLIQLGEDPSRIWTTGPIGVENIHKAKILSRNEVSDYLGLPPGKEYFLLTCHPATLARKDPLETLKTLLKILREKNFYYVFTGSNADKNGASINNFLMEQQKKDSRMRFFMSLGVLKYINAARYCKAVIGNSFSGMGEIASLQVPVLNIGDRQKGGVCSEAVVHCGNDEQSLRCGMDELLSDTCAHKAKVTPNPLDIPGSSMKIAEIIRNYPLADIMEKNFYDLPSVRDAAFI